MMPCSIVDAATLPGGVHIGVTEGSAPQPALLVPGAATGPDTYFDEVLDGDARKVASTLHRYGLESVSLPLAPGVYAFARTVSRARYCLDLERLDAAGALIRSAKELAGGIPITDAVIAPHVLNVLDDLLKNAQPAAGMGLRLATKGVRLEDLRETVAYAYQTLLSDAFTELRRAAEAKKATAEDIARFRKSAFDAIKPLIDCGVTPDVHAGCIQDVFTHDAAPDVSQLWVEAIAGRILESVRLCVNNQTLDGMLYLPDEELIWLDWRTQIGAAFDSRYGIPETIRIHLVLQDALNDPSNTNLRNRIVRLFHESEGNVSEPYRGERIMKITDRGELGPKIYYPRLEAAAAVFRVVAERASAGDAQERRQAFYVLHEATTAWSNIFDNEVDVIIATLQLLRALIPLMNADEKDLLVSACLDCVTRCESYDAYEVLLGWYADLLSRLYLHDIHPSDRVWLYDKFKALVSEDNPPVFAAHVPSLLKEWQPGYDHDMEVSRIRKGLSDPADD